MKLRDVVQTRTGAVLRKSFFASSKIRSRLRSASVRGFRAGYELFVFISKISATGEYLRLSIHPEIVSAFNGTTAVRQF